MQGPRWLLDEPCSLCSSTFQVDRHSVQPTSTLQTSSGIWVGHDPKDSPLEMSHHDLMTFTFPNSHTKARAPPLGK